MGRPSMSAETIRNNRKLIIRTTTEMIHEGGFQSVSARSIGSRIGMNSALIYRYFRDIDEVVLFACVHALNEYAKEMSAAGYDENCSAEELYILSWEFFSKHAFSSPEEFNVLFFSRHSTDLPAVIRDYYDLFPEDADNDPDYVIQAMFRTANLKERNLMVLIPALEGRTSQDNIILINEMTIAYFYALLIQLVGNEHSITADQQTARMLKAVRFTLNI